MNYRIEMSDKTTDKRLQTHKDKEGNKLTIVNSVTHISHLPFSINFHRGNTMTKYNYYFTIVTY